MNVTYFKDGVNQGNVEIPHRIWKGLQSRYEKTHHANIDRVWDLFKKHHANFNKLEISYQENKVETSS